MTIYIEEFLIQNIIINFCLLRLVTITTRYKTSTFRFFVSAIIGAVFSVFSANILTNLFFVNTMKLVCSVIMIFIAFKTNKKQFLYSYILLFIYTYSLGGAMMSFASYTSVTKNGIIMFSKYNLCIITCFIIILTYIFELALKHIKNKILNGNFTYKIKLISNKKSIKINAFLDTGNNLNYNGESVIILDYNIFFKLVDISFLVASEKLQLQSSTITGKNNLNLYKIEEIQIYSNHKVKTLKNQLIALDKNDSFKNCNYQALLSPSII